jgi:hypothetical protein
MTRAHTYPRNLSSCVPINTNDGSLSSSLQCDHFDHTQACVSCLNSLNKFAVVPPRRRQGVCTPQHHLLTRSPVTQADWFWSTRTMKHCVRLAKAVISVTHDPVLVDKLTQETHCCSTSAKSWGDCNATQVRFLHYCLSKSYHCFLSALLTRDNLFLLHPQIRPRLS